MFNYLWSLSPDWVPTIVENIRARNDKVFRLHVSGDFYSVDYINSWREIAQSCPDTSFYTYTRSWRKPILLPALLDLASEPNFYMWFSCDRDTGVPDDYDNVRTAYMSLDDDEKPYSAVDMIFRVNRKTEKTHYVLDDGTVVPVCMNECGIRHEIVDGVPCTAITCLECRFCYDWSIDVTPNEATSGDSDMERETVLSELGSGTGEDDGLRMRSGVQPELSCASASGNGSCGGCRNSGCPQAAHDEETDCGTQSPEDVLTVEDSIYEDVLLPPPPGCIAVDTAVFDIAAVVPGYVTETTYDAEELPAADSNDEAEGFVEVPLGQQRLLDLVAIDDLRRYTFVMNTSEDYIFIETVSVGPNGMVSTGRSALYDCVVEELASGGCVRIRSRFKLPQ